MPDRTNRLVVRLVSTPEARTVLEALPSVTIRGVDGAVVYGDPAGPGGGVPIELAGEPAGSASGPGAVPAAALLSLLLRQAEETRSVGAEALRRYRELNLRTALEHRLSECFTAQEVTAATLAELLRFYRAEAGAVLVFPADGSQPELLASDGEISLTAWAQARKVCHTRYGQVADAGGVLCVSVPDRDGTVLVLQGGSWSPNDLMPVQVVAERLAAALNTVEGHERRALLELQRARALEESRARRTFLANMSHELRTPMNAILGYADMLHDEVAETPGSEWMVADLDRIRQAGRQLLDLVSKILDLARVESGSLQLDVREVDVLSLCDRIVERLRSEASARGNTVSVAVPEGCRLFVDEARLEQILLNLVSNAIRFTENGQVRITVLPGQDGTSIRVADDGVGMSEHACAEVFDAFAQARRRVRREDAGAGLGLAISRQLCRLMGGDLTVSSELGVGSEFVVRLAPAAEAQASPPAA